MKLKFAGDFVVELLLAEERKHAIGPGHS